MAKRGRPAKRDQGHAQRGEPPKQIVSNPPKKRGRPAKRGIYHAQRGRPPKIQTTEPASIPDRNAPTIRDRQSHDSWTTALRLSEKVSNQYAMTESEQELAFNCALALQKSAVIVELGVMYGRTAIILCYAASLTGAHYYGIDNYRMGSSKETVETSLAKVNLTGTILKGDTNQVKWDKKIDYLLIDAGHDLLNMRQDVTRWLPFVNPGGLVLFHAYNPDIDYTDPHFPVKRFAEEHTVGWEQIAYIPYLLVKQKPI